MNNIILILKTFEILTHIVNLTIFTSNINQDVITLHYNFIYIYNYII